MSTTKRMDSIQHCATRLEEAEIPGATDTHALRKLTLAENVILTIKILAGFGLLGAALWAISLWKAVR